MSVEFVMAAEFDIDKGSSLSFHYPNQINLNHSYLAELMLPEGAHLHLEDSTFFILNSNLSLNYNFSLNQKLNSLSLSAISFTNNNNIWSNLYDNNQSISLINSILTAKNNDTLSLSWDLKNTQCLFNTCDLVLFPILDPPLAIRFQSVDERIYFIEFLLNTVDVQIISGEFPPDLIKLSNTFRIIDPLLYVINIVGTRQVAGARRGARVKSVAIAFQKPWVHVFKPLLLLALDQFFKNPDLEVIKRIYESLANLNTQTVPCLSYCEKKTMRSFLRNKVAHANCNFHDSLSTLKYYDPEDLELNLKNIPLEFELPIKYMNVTLPLKIPSIAYETEIGDFSLFSLISIISGLQFTTSPPPMRWKNNAPYSWHPHLDTGPQTQPLLILLFAILNEKRIMFVGHGKPCKEVTNCVLACIAMAGAGDMIPGTPKRCFPYASLANMDLLLETPGFIAGVTNPIFEEQTALWDVCININTNKMTLSPLFTKRAAQDKTPTNENQPTPCAEDEELAQEVFWGIKRHLDENYLRQLIYRYIQRFMELCQKVVTKPDTQVNLNWVNRIEGWTSTQSYQQLQQRHMRIRKSLFTTLNVRAMIHELMYPDSIAKPSVIVKSFLAIDQVVQEAGDAKVIEILSYLNSTDGTCLPFSYGLFHERLDIKMAAARIILRLFIQKLGESYVNPFVKLTVANLLTTQRLGIKPKLSKPSLKIGTSNLIINQGPLSSYNTPYDVSETPGMPLSMNSKIPIVQTRQSIPQTNLTNTVYSKILQTKSKNQEKLAKELSLSLGSIELDDTSLVPGDEQSTNSSDSFLNLYDYSNS